MSNATDQLSPASRALIAGVLIGGGASAASQWNSYKKGELAVDTLVRNSVKDAAKAGIISGAATAVAGQMAGRPILSAAALLTAGAASLYLMDNLKEKQNEQA